MGMRELVLDLDVSGNDRAILESDSFKRSKLFTFNPDYYSIEPDLIEGDIDPDEYKIIDLSRGE